MSHWREWKYYASYYGGLKIKLGLALALSLLQAILLAPIAFLTRRIFDELLPQGRFFPLAQTAGIILLLYLLGHGIALYHRHLCLGVTKRAIQRLRNDLIEKIYALSRHFFTRGDHSEIHTAIVQDTERVDVMTNTAISLFLPAVVVAAALGGVLISLDPLLFLVTAVSIPPLFWVAQLMSGKVRKKTAHFRREFKNFSGGILFAIKKFDLTRMQAAEEFEIRRQKGFVEELQRASTSMAWVISVFGAIQNSLVTLIGILVLLIGGWQVVRGRASVGDLMSFYVALALLRDQARILGASGPQIVAGKESLRSLLQILQIQDASPYQGSLPLSFRGVIRAEGLVFGYDRTEVLKGVDFTIEPGKVFVLAGPSGAGKSTLLKLLLGFYRPWRGRLWADGVSYEEIDFKHLRRQVGVILQDPFLFSGTVAENIRYGSEEAAEEDVKEAARLAWADDFIQSLPQGYETPVGDDGVRLSGGQCQRIAVARALLKTPAMLIFDEPTAHLDERSALSLMENIRVIAKQAAVLVVSHDRRLFSLANRVFYLENGLLTEPPAPFWEAEQNGRRVFS